MSKELDRAINLVNRRPIPPAIRELLEPLAAAAPEEEKLEFDDLYLLAKLILFAERNME